MVSSHTNDVIFINKPAAYLHVSMRAQGFFDVTPATPLWPQLDRLEPLDVWPVEEHEPDHGRLAVDLERVPGQHIPLDHQPVRISWM